MELISREELLSELHFLWDYCGNVVDEQASCVIRTIKEAPTIEAIPKDQYEARLKADMVAMLTDIRKKIEERKETIVGKYDSTIPEHDRPLQKCARNEGRQECIELIQEKIEALED